MTTTSATSSSGSTAATTPATTASASTKGQNGSAILTALNAGSGIDTGSLVTNLSSATFAPKEQALTAKLAANTAQVSSLGTLTGGIDAFASALSSLVSGGTLFTQVTTSDPTVLSATAQAGASIANLSAQVEVRQVAQAQSSVSAAFANAGSTVGTGSFTIAGPAGMSPVTVTLGATDNTLAGLARAINAGHSGLTASIVTDAGGARLAIKGASGAANAFTLTAGGDADADLQSFLSGVTTAQSAQDAIVRVDGVTVTRPSNTIKDVVPGVTLNLAAARPGTVVALGATVPTAAIGQAVNDFVSAYNELKGEIDTATAAPSGTTPAGPLYGNAAIRQMQRQLSRLSSTVLNSSGGPASLAEIGVSTNLDGTLALNQSTLKAALQNAPDAVEAMFNPTQHSDNPLIRITSAMGVAKPGTYAITNASAQAGATNAAATIAGKPGLPTLDGSGVYASVGSAASGLQIEPQGTVASATVKVDPGLGGALQAIRDALRANGGVLDALSTQLTDTQKDLADQRATLTKDESAYQDRLTSQFSAMNTRVSSYKSIQSYLTQQIAAWNKSDNN